MTIRLGSDPTARRPLREVLGLPPSSGSVRGSTFWKRANVCPRAARLYELGVRQSGPASRNLDTGDAFHLVLEQYYRARRDGLAWRDATAAAWQVLTPLRDEPGYEDIGLDLDRMLGAYFEIAEHDQWRVLAVEEDLTWYGETFDYSARLDLVVEDLTTNTMWIVEHKTAKVISGNAMMGYHMDLQTLGQMWLMQQCVDLAQYPPFGGVIVNMMSKQTVPKHQRVSVPVSPSHLREFERSLVQRQQLMRVAADLGHPKMFGNCTGAAQYFGACAYFNLCYGRPDFDIAGVDRLLPDELPFGFTIADTDVSDED